MWFSLFSLVVPLLSDKQSTSEKTSYDVILSGDDFSIFFHDICSKYFLFSLVFFSILNLFSEILYNFLRV